LKRSAQNGSLVYLIAGAMLLRGAVLLFDAHALEGDPDGYRALAVNLVQHGTFGANEIPTAFRPPLYPLVLAGCVVWGSGTRAAIGLVHWVLGVATVWIAERLGRLWGLRRGATLAAALVACDPILLAQSTQLMTETLATFLAAAALLALTRAQQTGLPRWALLAGACCGLAVLCRPTFLPWTLLVGPMLAWASRRKQSEWEKAEAAPRAPPHPAEAEAARNRRTQPTQRSSRCHAASLLLVFFAGLGLTLAPWALRNLVHFGRPIVTTTHGGYTLLRANNPYYYRHLREASWGAVWDSAELDRQWLAKAPRGTPADELRADRLAYAEARENIRRQPLLFVYASLVRLSRFFGLVPYRTAPQEGALTLSARYAIGLWYLMELLLALIGVCAVVVEGTRKRKAENASFGWCFGILMVACFAGIHSVYWTDLRMRAPCMVVIALAAAAGFRRAGTRD